MNLFDLESFVAVVDSGSIMGAAARLHLTQSAITRRVQNLEEALGVPLLDRQTRPLQPTRAGQDAYRFARPVLDTVNDLKSAVAHNGEPAGEFRFGVVRGLGDLALLEPLASLRQTHPALQLHAVVQGTITLLRRLEGRSLDAAALLFSEGVDPPSSLVTEYLGKQSFVVVAPKSSVYALPVGLSELSSHGWIVNPEGCGTRQSIADAFARRGLPFQIIVEAEGKDFQLAMVARGLGLAVVPPQVLDGSPVREELQVLEVEDFTPTQNVWMVHSREIAHQAKAVECLRNAIVHNMERAGCGFDGLRQDGGESGGGVMLSGQARLKNLASHLKNSALRVG
jgi:DNA-binding transcriptional LysR family regulator